MANSDKNFNRVIFQDFCHGPKNGKMKVKKQQQRFFIVYVVKKRLQRL